MCLTTPTLSLSRVPLLVDATPMAEHALQDNAHTFEEPHGQAEQGQLVLDLMGWGYRGLVSLYFFWMSE